MNAPAVSVIVPTRNRAGAVLRLLNVLARQEPVPGGFEVIVVADGCSDGTEARVRALKPSFDLQVLELAPSGPALARNCGAALARGEILLFLDDDVEPAPGTVCAHAELHQRSGHRVGLGYLPPIPSGTGFFAASLRGWWESMFDGPRRPGHRYSFRDLLSGHFSIRRADFDALQGFDTGLTCHEDWELGIRAIDRGLQLTFAPAAMAWHHESTDLAKALRRKFDEGRADVHLARIHPAVTRALPIGWTKLDEAARSRIVNLAWRRPALGDRVIAALMRMLPVYERWRLRFRWRALLERAMTYWYWRGVASAIEHDWDALLALRAQRSEATDPAFLVDLAEGVGVACTRVDERRPKSLTVMYRGRLVGDIPDQPGSEPLRGVHLRAALAGVLALRFAQALSAEHELPDVVDAILRAHAAAVPGSGAGSPDAFAAA
jgi:GT2 family glycosyltransferase